MSDIRTSSLGGIPFGNTAARPANPVVGTVYYNGQLEIIEIYNGTAWVANSAPPAVPTIVSVTDVGTGLAYATGGTFNIVVAPGSGGSTPLQYNVVTSAGGFSTNSNSTNLSLTGLTSNTSFVLSANAQNNFGTTVNSSPYSSVLATTVPQAPTIGTATLSGTNVLVTWTLGNNGGKNLTSITITPYLNGVTAQTPATAETTSSTSHTFIGLTGASSYTFKVKATNANGTSQESANTNSVVIPVVSEYLVVAGGGGAGSSNGAAGAGAGGMKSGTLALTPGNSITVTVGSGGSGSTDGSSKGGNGTGSQFGSITTTGGGGSGSEGSGSVRQGNDGGSGGGSVRSSYPGGAGVSGEGNNGGANVNDGSPHYAGGGGGGKGAAGQDGTASGNGAGGIGAQSSITGTATYYAGGGGAGYYNNGSGQATGGAGGNGGGAAGGSNPSDGRGRNGSNNTGGGGGGHGLVGQQGGNGGSGVVIIAVPSQFSFFSIGVGLTYTIDTSSRSGYKVYTFTAGTGTVTV